MQYKYTNNSISIFCHPSQACLDCICRGCQNSYMANGEKKLEAFAVPEKALEQTRLTLGINLTSITAAAALRNPATTSIRANTLLNVATATGTPVTTAFLSPGSPQEANYEDSLELLIGWEAGTLKNKTKKTTTHSLVLIECDGWSMCLSDNLYLLTSRGEAIKGSYGSVLSLHLLFFCVGKHWLVRLA